MLTKIRQFDKTILVKANKVTVKRVNNEILGVEFSKDENGQTRWLVFKYTESNLNKLMNTAKLCEQQSFWNPDLMEFKPTWVEYLDLNHRKDVVGHKVELEVSGCMKNIYENTFIDSSCEAKLPV